MADDNKESSLAGGSDDLLFDDLDFGDDDEDLLSALQVTKKSEHTLDVSEFFEDLETDGEDEGEAPEGTIVLSSLEAAELDGFDDAPETTVLGESGAIPETTVLGESGAIPETTVLGESGAIPEAAVPETPAAAPETTALSESGAAPEAVQPAEPAEPDEAPTTAVSDASGELTATDVEVEPTRTEGGTAGAAASAPEGEGQGGFHPTGESNAHPASDSTAPSGGGNRKIFVIAIIAVIALAVAAILLVVSGTSSSEPSQIASSSSQEQQESSSESATDEKTTYSIVVEYRDAQTGKALQSSWEQDVTEGEIPKAVTPEAISGYEVVRGSDNDFEFFTPGDRGKGKEAKLNLTTKNPSNHRVVFTYAKKVGYTVRYLENGTDGELAPSKVVDGMLSGDSATEHAIDIDGFVLASEADVTITLVNDDAANVITFRYDKKPEEPAPAATNTAPAQSQPTYYQQPTYSRPAPAPAPAAPADDAVDGSW